MAMRSTKSTLTFEHPFLLSGYTDELPAGDYDVVVEEELLEGLSFAAYRRTATYLTVRGKGAKGWTGRTAIDQRAGSGNGTWLGPGISEPK